jgi:hypothetical protein
MSEYTVIGLAVAQKIREKREREQQQQTKPKALLRAVTFIFRSIGKRERG